MRIRYYIIGAALSIALLLPSLTTAKITAVPKMYMFGLAASFNDTIVHFTEIQAVDSAWVNTKNKFLLGRESYSLQLRNYLAENDMPARTTIVIFDRKLSRLQKKYLKMKKLYTGTKKAPSHNDIRIIETDRFQFTTVNMSDQVITEEPAAPAPKKAKKKKKQRRENED